jgi:hypothetical protein
MMPTVALTDLRAWIHANVQPEPAIWSTWREEVHIVGFAGTDLTRCMAGLRERFGIEPVVVAGQPHHLVFLNYDPATVPDSWPGKQREPLEH